MGVFCIIIRWWGGRRGLFYAQGEDESKSENFAELNISLNCKTIEQNDCFANLSNNFCEIKTEQIHTYSNSTCYSHNPPDDKYKLF